MKARMTTTDPADGSEDPMPRQKPTYRCDCGRNVPVVPESLHEFAWRCECGRAGVISWSNEEPPPDFEHQADIGRLIGDAITQAGCRRNTR